MPEARWIYRGNIADFLPDIKYFLGYKFVKNVRKPAFSRVE
jgi:hypothetical protein